MIDSNLRHSRFFRVPAQVVNCFDIHDFINNLRLAIDDFLVQEERRNGMVRLRSAQPSSERRREWMKQS